MQLKLYYIRVCKLKMYSVKCLWIFAINFLLVGANEIVKLTESDFSDVYKWNYINFTWPSSEAYNQATSTEEYIPQNNAIAGIKIYKNKMFFALPRIRSGVPVTLAFIPLDSSPMVKPLLAPYPSWEMNNWSDCSAFHSVHSMEIDPHGIMWVLDGMRINNNTRCPPKLVLLDLNDNGKVVHTYTFPEHVSLQDGGYLNDIVIDATDEVYAYITDLSSIDPGLVVYSSQYDKAWKIRDKTMFAELNAANYTVEGLVMKKLMAIDGIALSPLPESQGEERFVYFTALVGYNLYAISTNILKNEELCKQDTWRRNVELIGQKQSQTDGMMMDNKGNLYYTLLPLYGVARWNIHESFESSDIMQQNRDTMVWPDSFAFDSNGYIYLLSDNMNKFLDLSYDLKLTDKMLFHVAKKHTGTKSYMFK